MVLETFSEGHLDKLHWNSEGLLPAIIQDAQTKQVLMLAWMSRESLHQSLALKETVFWSRSREELWHKGTTSGNTQRIVGLYVDCDEDTLLLLVEPHGPSCHTGAVSCFYRTLDQIMYKSELDDEQHA
ncbi:MAG: phosphoribosyl-AMP cyclohydrolase [Anaerolineae bacterium]|nr:phosphoribosyl-AMP cyclohydrolase [Anaerolineae bacterium]MDW8173245.1 phosphoribosyl-AMP cyclohydrolase [Anaerolineae bacterium]